MPRKGSRTERPLAGQRITSTVRPPLREMGEVAAQTLVQRIEAGGRAPAPRVVRVQLELIARGTTGPRR